MTKQEQNDGAPPWMPKVGDLVVIIHGDGAPVGSGYRPVQVVHVLDGWRFLLGDGSGVYLDKHITDLQPAPPASASTEPTWTAESILTADRDEWREQATAAESRVAELEKERVVLIEGNRRRAIEGTRLTDELRGKLKAAEAERDSFYFIASCLGNYGALKFRMPMNSHGWRVSISLRGTTGDGETFEDQTIGGAIRAVATHLRSASQPSEPKHTCRPDDLSAYCEACQAEDDAELTASQPSEPEKDCPHKGCALKNGHEGKCKRSGLIEKRIATSPFPEVAQRSAEKKCESCGATCWGYCAACHPDLTIGNAPSVLGREAIRVAETCHWSAREYGIRMANAQGLDRGRHSVTKLLAHLVCVTKYRRKVLDAKGLATIEAAMRRVASEMSFAVVELNGEADHVHVVVRYPPKLSISKIVNSLKGVSSRRYREAGHRMPSRQSLWSPSYFASSVGGAPIEVLRQYVQNQEAGLKSGVSDPGEI